MESFTASPGSWARRFSTGSSQHPCSCWTALQPRSPNAFFATAMRGTVDLPPRWGVAVGTVAADVNRFQPPRSPTLRRPGLPCWTPGSSPASCCLPRRSDMLRATCCHTSPGRRRSMAWYPVAGLALYGDIEAAIASGEFVPSLFLVSGRVFNHDGDDQNRVRRERRRARRPRLARWLCCRSLQLQLRRREQGLRRRAMCEDWLYTLDRLTRGAGVSCSSCLPGISLRISTRRSAGVVPRPLTGGSGALVIPQRR